ncbi:predicted protein [Thalassiosira pseudonana CCMP1335]|uniref:Plastid lipid-associated protein/fibrillin conserved domain-containing protein n=1 Tax=Thalassiosira pseudonana TaxID=35128 RepID=B8C6Q5_THAPS|nr:predicted protein [Thalassiosira pseudonana CCMP1335]EED90613.1 predicted protein [Thalassiosira pseudonana CCMP1335]
MTISLQTLLALATILLSSVIHSFTTPYTSSLIRPPLSSSSQQAPSTCSSRKTTVPSKSGLCMSSETEVEDIVATVEVEDEDDDDMEWVEEEFELLTERDFYNTEWKIGTLMENKPRRPESIDTTWVRLQTNEAGENTAVWGDKSKGKWTIDVPSQFFSVSKETFGGWFGKQIWAGTIEDFYFLEGTVRAWSPISPASVIGQWQAIRLGVEGGDRVTVEERGVAPWFMEKDDDDYEEEEEIDEEVKNTVDVGDSEVLSEE